MLPVTRGLSCFRPRPAVLGVLGPAVSSVESFWSRLAAHEQPALCGETVSSSEEQNAFSLSVYCCICTDVLKRNALVNDSECDYSESDLLF